MWNSEGERGVGDVEEVELECRQISGFVVCIPGARLQGTAKKHRGLLRVR
jgi:hypothetical protein